MRGNRLPELLDDGAAAIFLFHGVLESPRPGVRNYTGKHLPAAEFTTILDDLGRAGNAVSLPHLAAACAGDAELPPRAFAITFDDGFANNHTVAAPALAERRIPATFYVTTGFVEVNDGSWIDRIEYAVERVPSFTLELPFADAGASYSTREEKVALLEAVRRYGKSGAEVDPYGLADEVWRQLGVEEYDRDPELDDKLTWEQVRDLAGHELFTVGGHGLTHRILEHLTDDDLEQEVAEGLARLRDHAGRVEHFAYPEGQADCYSDRVVAVLRRHGITCAVTAEPGVNRPGDDLFRLRRFLVA